MFKVTDKYAIATLDEVKRIEEEMRKNGKVVTPIGEFKEISFRLCTCNDDIESETSTYAIEKHIYDTEQETAETILYATPLTIDYFSSYGSPYFVDSPCFKGKIIAKSYLVKHKFDIIWFMMDSCFSKKNYDRITNNINNLINSDSEEFLMITNCDPLTDDYVSELVPAERLS